MMSLLPAEAVELAVRAAATASFVILVTIAIGRLGPSIGGALGGLPIVLGPGFVFLVAKASATFVADAASYSLLSLCATQVFLLAYIVAAGRATPTGSLALAATAWSAAAVSLRLLPPRPWLGLVLFLAVTAFAQRAGARFRGPTPEVRRADTFGLLLLRGGLAGVLVAVVTATANRLGAGWSGLLLAFPVGYSVIAVTVHERLGRATVVATLHSAMLGTLGLAGFCLTLALASTRWSPSASIVAAFAVSFAITAALVAARMADSPAAGRRSRS